MIYTERKVSIKNDKATIDSPIILFRGDREVEIMFTIVDSKFKFESNKGNVIDKTQAAFGQLAVALPDGTDLFTEIVETKNGVVVFSITGEMIDEIHEVGFYSFHIRLYNDDKTSRITLPPVMEGIEIREPLIIEGDVENTDLVGDATVGYSMVQAVGTDEEVFDEDGNYIPTVWGIGDKITAEKLNKMEEGISNAGGEDTRVDDILLNINDMSTQIDDINSQIEDVSEDIYGNQHYTLSKRLNNIESGMLSPLGISCKVVSNNLINDTLYKDTLFNRSFVIPINGDFLEQGSYYVLNIYFSDDVKVSAECAVWKWIQEDGTESSGTISVGTYRTLDMKPIAIKVEYTSSGNAEYKDKRYAKIILNKGMSEKEYDEYKLGYDSTTIDSMYETIDACLSDDELFVESYNLFDINEVTYGLELQPYNVVENENMAVTGYLPINNGESLYVYPGLGGSQVANLYDVNKNKIGWVSLSTTANVQNVIEKDDVAYIRFNIPTSYLNENMTVSKNTILIPGTPTKILNETLLDPNNYNITTNWWHGKKGDSLGDSLTGMGYMQKYTSMYFNLSSFKNHGVGGSKLSGDNVDDTRPSMWQDSRIDELSDDVDFITILGGQNDGEVVIGELTKDNMDTNTYVGALNTIIEKIYTKYSGNIIIILCTPFYVPSRGDNDMSFKALGDAVIEVGKMHGLPVADFGGMSGANKFTKDVYWSDTDRTHPTEQFFIDRVAPILISTMEKIKPINFDVVKSINYNQVQ